MGIDTSVFDDFRFTVENMLDALHGSDKALINHINQELPKVCAELFALHIKELIKNHELVQVVKDKITSAFKDYITSAAFDEKVNGMVIQFFSKGRSDYYDY